MKTIYIAALMTFAALPLGAQTLEKEIVIDREIVPEMRAVSRLNNYPQLSKPEIKPKRLSFHDINATAEITGSFATLEPAASANAITLSKHKGYASIGYFPTYNLGISAGYRIINTHRTSLGAWVQFDGKSYGWNPIVGPDYAVDKLHRNSITGAVDFSHIFAHAGRLDINANYSYHWLNRPWQNVDSTYTANAFNVQATWSARKHDMIYFIEGDMRHFGFSGKEHSIPASSYLSDGLSQNIISFRGGTSYFITSNSAIAGLASVDFVSYNHLNGIYYTESSDPVNGDYNAWTPMLIAGDGKTLGLINLQPSYRYHTSTLTLKIGVKAQISTNSGKTFHIAPDVALNWKPASMFEISASADGGEYINTLSRLFAINPYMSPSLGYNFSHRPILFDASMKIGPFRGFAVKMFAGYAAANDWLMPLGLNPMAGAIEGYPNLAIFAPVNLTAWHGGAAIEFKVADLIEGEVCYTFSPNSYHHSDPRNMDRAKQVLDIKLTSHPIDRLTIDAGFQMRQGRKLYNSWNLSEGLKDFDLNQYNNLRIGANYRIFDWFSVYGQVENLLNCQADDIWMARCQGVHGLVGVNFKF